MPIAHHVAADLRDACAQIARNRNAALLAGGTLVMGAVNTGDIATTTLVDIEKLGLRKITFSAAKVTLGAMTTMADIANHPKLGFLAPVARAIGGPAVRAMATVGGNLYAPSPYGDLGVALLALDAEVSLVSAQRQKTLPLEAFFKDRGNLGPIMVASVAFKPPAKDAFRFTKAIRRRPVSASVLSIAAVLPHKAGKLSGRASPMAPWRQRPSAPGRLKRRWKASRLIPRPSRRLSQWRPRIVHRPAMNMRAPGIAAKSCRCIWRGFCRGVRHEQDPADLHAQRWRGE